MNKKPSIIVFFWLLSLTLIPLLSIYGRPIQSFLKNNLTPEQLIFIIGFILFIICVKATYWLIRKHSYQRIWHLAWFIPLFLIAPYFMTIIEERVHFIVFGSFGFLSMLVFTPKVAITLCISISLLDEGLQWYLPDRVGDIHDVGINIVASLAGATFAYISWKR